MIEATVLLFILEVPLVLASWLGLNLVMVLLAGIGNSTILSGITPYLVLWRAMILSSFLP